MAIVACINERSVNAFVAAIKKAQRQGAAIAEPRIDSLDSEIRICSIIPKSALPVIATCRKRCDGGRFEGPEEQRLRILEMAIAAGAAYVDVELEAGAERIKLLRRVAERKGCQTMVSKHSFTGTPSMSVLVKWLEEAAELGDMVKIVTMAKSHGDCIDVLHLLKIAESRHVNLVAFAMGEDASWTRVVSLKLGSPLTYCSLSEEVAPGQMTIGEMRLSIELLRASPSMGQEQVL